MARLALSNRYLPWRSLTMRWRDAAIAWRQHATTTQVSAAVASPALVRMTPFGSVGASVDVASAGDVRLTVLISTRYRWGDLTQRWRDYAQPWRTFTGAVWAGVQAAAGTCGHAQMGGYCAAQAAGTLALSRSFDVRGTVDLSAAAAALLSARLGVASVAAVSASAWGAPGVQAGLAGAVACYAQGAADAQMVQVLTAFRSRMGRSTQTWRI
jgi:hypothetical protein